MRNLSWRPFVTKFIKPSDTLIHILSQHCKCNFQSIESSSKNLPQIYQRFTNHLPMIYQRFTKNKKIFGILLSKYLPRIYQRFTNDLPKTYQRFTKSTKHLPTAYQNIFQFTTDLPQIYQQFTKNVWTKIFWYFYMYFLKNI